jgi:hypothetical protein
VVIGAGRHLNNPHPVGNSLRNKYFTDCDISDVRFAQGLGYPLRLARGLAIERIGEDVFASTPMVVNCTATNVNPGSTGWHSDAWQSPPYYSTGGIQNYIVYNYRATDLHCQGLFSRVSVLSSNNAFVNVFMELRAPVVSAGFDALYGDYDHLLMWHCTFIGTNTGHAVTFLPEPSTGGFSVTNASFLGGVWDEWKTTEGIGWTQAPDVEFYDNHYIVSTGFNTYTPDSGDTKSIGDAGMVTDPDDPNFGRPAGPSSPLVGRISAPSVPVDLGGEERGASGEVGAYEY